MRPGALWAATLLVLVACTTPTPGGPSGGGSGPGAEPGTSAAGTGSQARYDDAGALGSMTKVFLRASPARRMVVEVDWVKGREPAQSALDHLSSVLRAVADKPGGIAIRKGNELAAAADTYSIADIQSVERANRASHSSGNVATMWIVYLNGSYTDQGTLGISYDATSAAIFRDRIDDATTALVNEPAVERAVLTHEAGHLLALVNIGYKSRRDHEDPQHPHHSKNQGSVMYWAVEDVSLRSLLAGGPPDSFDDDDRADLAMLKAS